MTDRDQTWVQRGLRMDVRSCESVAVSAWALRGVIRAAAQPWSATTGAGMAVRLWREPSSQSLVASLGAEVEMYVLEALWIAVVACGIGFYFGRSKEPLDPSPAWDRRLRRIACVLPVLGLVFLAHAIIVTVF